MPDDPLPIRRILGGGPFPEVGKPNAVVRDDARGLVAIGGSVGNLDWTGRSFDHWRGYRVGVYGLDDLRCRRLVHTHWPVLDLALHPHLPLLAIGTGAYDGGYLYEGELLIVDLESGTAVLVLEDHREVRRVHWREDGRALELVVAPPDDRADARPQTHGFAPIIERDDWRRIAPRSISYKELRGPRVKAARRPEGAKQAARETLTALADAHGVTWSPRRQVRAVEALDDGRVLATLEGTKLESRLPSGEVAWSVPDLDGGREIHVSPDDQTSAWVNLPRVGWAEVPSTIERISLADGSTLDGPQPVGCHELANVHFAVRRSPELLLLQSGWVATVDPAKRDGDEPEVRRLFPLDADGPAVRVAGSDGTGNALVHAGEVHGAGGPTPAPAFVARQRFPDGVLQWTFPADHPVTALDSDGETVFAALLSGEVIALDAADGTLRWRTRLMVDGAPTVALSLTAPAPGRLLLGTVDGRILLCEPAVPSVWRLAATGVAPVQ
ncbi:PQQ-binding-like beta-propeller repeat protein [Kitasatospora sp. NPDC008115]|uniref:outer membrane protein assembly factor BamB family protein n=1 Tax=Kitasatospora sp. NPDC008115 TaxID=3364022 RepID=UPI0036DFBBD6